MATKKVIAKKTTKPAAADKAAADKAAADKAIGNYIKERTARGANSMQIAAELAAGKHLSK